MTEEKFKILQFIRELIYAIEKELSNFPKKDIEIKVRIRTSLYDMLEIAYEANTTQNIEIKKELIEKIISKVKVIDFLISMAHDNKLITDKKYCKLGLRLGDIAKYSNSWLKNISQGTNHKLASPSGNNTNNLLNANNGGNVNNNNYNNTNNGARPVASKKLGMLVLRFNMRSFRIETDLCSVIVKTIINKSWIIRFVSRY